MQQETNTQDLKERLALIETMIAEGRSTTESWGWTFVLWGVAYYVAMAWSTWGHSDLAWPVTMTAACVLMVVLVARKKRSRPETTLGRAMSAIWTAAGVSMFVLLFSLALSGRYEPHSFVAIVGAMLGSTNAASSLILKWKMQFACAAVWWAAAVTACFGSATLTTAAFVGAIFFCQIVFGIYAMICESRRRRHGGAVHA